MEPSNNINDTELSAAQDLLQQTAFDGMSEKEMLKEMEKQGLLPGKHKSVYTKSKPSKTERKKKRKQQKAARKQNRGKTKGQKRSS